MVVETALDTRLRSARDAGARFLMEHQRADGAIGEPERDGLGPYYKTAWALAGAGETAAANRLLTWIRRNVQTPEGDFAGELRGRMHDRNYAYPNAWILGGALKLERYDVSVPGVRFLRTLQHPETGGFRMERDREDAVQDVLNASQAGNALLLSGNVDAALRVGAFLRTVMDAQPNPESELFFVWKPGSGLRTDFPEERQFLHSIRTDKGRQPYFNAGIGAAFLCRLAMATGDDAWVELAKRYIEITFHTMDEMYETAQVGKVGWGSALIASIDPDERYLQLATRVGDAMLAQQTPEGAWNNTGGYTTDAIRIEVTAEFVMLLDEMAGALGAR